MTADGQGMLDLGERLKRKGTTNALYAESLEWLGAAEAALDFLCRARPEGFTSDDLRDMLASEPNSPQAWGGILSQAARAGRIVSSGFEISTRPSRHGGVLRRWRAR